MAADDFRKALAFTLKYEGGYANNRYDHGGPTMKGITQRTYDAWRHVNGGTPRPVKQITDDEVAAIYHEDYWVPASCPGRPLPVAMALFDFAVNSGPVRALRYWHQVPATTDPLTAALSLCDLREQFFRAIGKGTQARFLAGWLARVNALRQAVKTA